MATITTPVLTIVRDVANVDVSVAYTINWTEFDRNSDLQYLETWKLIEDDTGQDGDKVPANGDDRSPSSSASLPSSRPTVRRRRPARSPGRRWRSRTSTRTSATTRSAPSSRSCHNSRWGSSARALPSSSSDDVEPG